MVSEDSWQKVSDAIRKADEKYAGEEAQKGLRAAELAEDEAAADREWQATIDLTREIFSEVASALADRITFKSEEGETGPMLELAFDVGKGSRRLRYVFENRNPARGGRPSTIREVVVHGHSFSRDVPWADFSRSWLRRRVEDWVEEAVRS